MKIRVDFDHTLNDVEVEALGRGSREEGFTAHDCFNLHNSPEIFASTQVTTENRDLLAGMDEANGNNSAQSFGGPK